jgi:four helix bundle protein
MEKMHFNFKDLLVWQKAMDFADQVIRSTDNLNTSRNHFRLIEQLESSCASVPQNIAEGKGRRTDREFIQFLYFSRASLYETITLLNLFQRRKWISGSTLENHEEIAFEIVCMIKGLINSLK